MKDRLIHVNTRKWWVMKDWYFLVDWDEQHEPHLVIELVFDSFDSDRWCQVLERAEMLEKRAASMSQELEQGLFPTTTSPGWLMCHAEAVNLRDEVELISDFILFISMIFADFMCLIWRFQGCSQCLKPLETRYRPWPGAKTTRASAPWDDLRRQRQLDGPPTEMCPMQLIWDEIRGTGSMWILWHCGSQVKDVPSTNAMDLRPPRFAKRILVTSFFA